MEVYKHVAGAIAVITGFSSLVFGVLKIMLMNYYTKKEAEDKFVFRDIYEQGCKFESTVMSEIKDDLKDIKRFMTSGSK